MKQTIFDDIDPEAGSVKAQPKVPTVFDDIDPQAGVVTKRTPRPDLSIFDDIDPLTGNPVDVQRDRAVKAAESFAGTPYVWGGKSKRGTDCSGLVCQVADDIGVKVPRTAKEQWAKGEPVDPNKAGKGDLVFFDTGNRKHSGQRLPNGQWITHVGILDGNGNVIHASSRAGEVVKTPLNKMALSIVGMRRLVEAPKSDTPPWMKTGMQQFAESLAEPTPSKESSAVADVLSKGYDDHYAKVNAAQIHIERVVDNLNNLSFDPVEFYSAVISKRPTLTFKGGLDEGSVPQLAYVLGKAMGMSTEQASRLRDPNSAEFKEFKKFVPYTVATPFDTNLSIQRDPGVSNVTKSALKNADAGVVAQDSVAGTYLRSLSTIANSPAQTARMLAGDTRDDKELSGWEGAAGMLFDIAAFAQPARLAAGVATRAGAALGKEVAMSAAKRGILESVVKYAAEKPLKVGVAGLAQKIGRSVVLEESVEELLPVVQQAHDRSVQTGDPFFKSLSEVVPETLKGFAEQMNPAQLFDENIPISQRASNLVMQLAMGLGAAPSIKSKVDPVLKELVNKEAGWAYKLGEEVRANEAKAAKSVSYPGIKETTSDKFRKAIASAKDSQGANGPAVTVYSTKEYGGMKTFLMDNGKAGFALNGDDIVSVFNHKEGVRGSAKPLLERAVAEGGRRLDAFDTALPKIYGKSGFVEVARLPWNDDYAPDGWDYKAMEAYNGGRPDVVFMVYDPTGKAESKGNYVEDYDGGIAAQKAATTKAPKVELDTAKYFQYSKPTLIEIRDNVDLKPELREAAKVEIERRVDLKPGKVGDVVFNPQGEVRIVGEDGLLYTPKADGTIDARFSEVNKETTPFSEAPESVRTSTLKQHPWIERRANQQIFEGKEPSPFTRDAEWAVGTKGEIGTEAARITDQLGRINPKFVSIVEDYQHSVPEGIPGVMDRTVGTPMGDTIRDAYEPLRALLRAKYGDTVTLWRAQDPVKGVRGKPLTAWTLNKKVAEAFLPQSPGRTLVSQEIPIDAIYAGIRTPARPLEFLVEESKLAPNSPKILGSAVPSAKTPQAGTQTPLGSTVEGKEPETLYHGGGAEYDELKPGTGMDGDGIYLTTDENRAMTYAKRDNQGIDREPHVTQAQIDPTLAKVWDDQANYVVSDVLGDAEAQRIYSLFEGQYKERGVPMPPFAEWNKSQSGQWIRTTMIADRSNKRLLDLGYNVIKNGSDRIVLDPKVLSVRKPNSAPIPDIERRANQQTFTVLRTGGDMVAMTVEGSANSPITWPVNRFEKAFGKPPVEGETVTYTPQKTPQTGTQTPLGSTVKGKEVRRITVGGTDHETGGAKTEMVLSEPVDVGAPEGLSYYVGKRSVDGRWVVSNEWMAPIGFGKTRAEAIEKAKAFYYRPEASKPKAFHPDQELVATSPDGKLKTTVSYRGPGSNGKAVVFDPKSGMQFEVETSRLSDPNSATTMEPVVAKTNRKNKVVTDEAYKEAVKKLTSGGALSGVDTEKAKAIVVVGAYWIERGYNTFADWSEQVVAVVGKMTQKQLERLWDDSKKISGFDDKHSAANAFNEVRQQISGVIDMSKLEKGETYTLQEMVDSANERNGDAGQPNAERDAAIDERAHAIIANTETLSKEDVGDLLWRLTRIEKQIADSKKATDSANVTGHRKALAQTELDIRNAYATILHALQVGGREQSLAFNLRRAIVNNDMSYEGVIRRLALAEMAAHGSADTSKYEAAVKVIVEEHEGNNAEIAKLVEKRSKAPKRIQEATFAQIKKEIASKPKSTKADLHARRAAALKRIQAKFMGGPMSMMGAGTLNDVASDIREIASTILEEFSTITVPQFYQRLRAIVRTAVPDATDYEIDNALSGYGIEAEPADTNAAKEKLRQFKAYSRVVSKIADFIENIDEWTPPKRGGGDPELQAQIDWLNKSLRYTKWLGAREAKLLETVNNLAAQLEGKYRDIAPHKARELAKIRAASLPPSIRELIEKSNTLRRTMKEADTIDHLKAAIKDLEEGTSQLDQDIEAGVYDRSKTEKAALSMAQQEIKELRKQKEKLERDKKSGTPAEVYERVKRVNSRIAELERQIRSRKFDDPRNPTAYLMTDEEWRLRQRQAKLQATVNNLKKHLDDSPAKRLLFEIMEVPRTLQTMADMSALFRQGLGVLYTNPKAWKTGFAEAWRAVDNEAYMTAIATKIEDSPNARAYKEMGLDLLPMDGFTYLTADTNYDFFQDDIMDRSLNVRVIGPALDAIKKPIVAVRDASSRHMATFLNSARTEMADRLLELYPDIKNDPKALKEVGAYINELSGSAPSPFNRESKGVRFFFMAPRFMASRFNLAFKLLPRLIGKHPAPVKRLAAQQLMATASHAAILYATTYLVNKVMGNENDEDKLKFSLDPTSSDFGKIRWGNQRYDTFAGLATPFRLLSAIVQGGWNAVSNDEEVSAQLQKMTDVAKRALLDYKLGPLPKAGLELALRKDIVGKETTPWKTLSEMFIPITISETIDSAQSLKELDGWEIKDEPGISDIEKKNRAQFMLMSAIFNFFGGGAAYYESRKNKKAYIGK